MTDFNYRLISSVYHSNSGGETQRASDVWLKDVDYLQAVMDPYSLDQPNAKWYDTIYFDKWKAYLLDKGMGSVKRPRMSFCTFSSATEKNILYSMRIHF